MTDQGVRIFVVEDEARISMEISDRLSGLGYVVVGIAARGETALERCPHLRPDIVLLDINLAGTPDGVETAERLKGVLDIPVVFLTAHSDDAPLRRALAAGPAAFVVQPFDIRELHATLQAALYKHRFEQSMRIASRELTKEVSRRTAELSSNEARLRRAQQIARMGDWVLDLATGAIDWSETLYTIFERDPAVFRPSLDAYFNEIVHPDDLTAVRAEQQAAVATGTQRSMDHRVLLPGGREIWAHLEATAEYDESGQPVRLRGIAQDITERKLAEFALQDVNTTLEWSVDQRTRELAASERFSAGILDAIGAQLAVLDASGRIVATNRSWREFATSDRSDPRLLGAGANYLEVCDRAVGDAAAAAHRIAEGIRGVLDGRLGSFAHEYPCDVDGARRWFVARVAPFSQDGPPMMVVTHDDVTMVHQARERAAEGERLFASLSLASPVGVFRTDAAGRCEHVNRQWCEMTGLGESDALGDGWQRALHPDDRSRVADEWAATAAAGSVFRSEYRFVQPGGRHLWVLGQAVPISGPAGEAVGMIGTLTDITDRKKVETAMRALANDLVALHGDDYFEAALRRLAGLVGADVAFVTRFDPLHADELRTPVLVEFGSRRSELAYPLSGTPCADVRVGAGRVITSAVRAAYPTDVRLADWAAESYAGEALVDHAGRVLGTVAVVSQRPLRDPAIVATILRIFAVALAAEIAQDRDRRRYEDLFEFAPSGLVLCDRQGRIVMVNRRAEQLFGWEAAELMGQPIEVLVPPSSRAGLERLRDAFQQSAVRRTMTARRRMLLALRRDGWTFPAEIEVASVETEEGQMVAVAVRDVSERVKADDAVEALRRHLVDTIESTEQAMILYDAEDRVAVFNQQFLALYPGLEDLLRPGVPFETLMRAIVARGLQAVPAGDEERYLADRLTVHSRADGVPFVSKLPDGRTVSLSDRRSRNGGVVTVGTDITELLAQETRVREMQKMDAIGKLTGGMAHDFNNYLGVIIGSLDLLQECTADRPDALELVESARAGAMRAAELTRSLLAFARRQPLDAKPTDLRPHLESLGVLLSRSLGEDIRLSLDVAPDLWSVSIDASQFASSVVNLANNARDAIPDGGEIRIGVQNARISGLEVDAITEIPAGDYVLVEVVDFGVGIAPHILTRVFEPFFTTKSAGHGTGLGLSMVYGFVTQSGGTVRVYSEVGHGTVVRMYLPRTVVRAAASDVRPGLLPLPARGHETILAVEDNEAIRRTVVAQLKTLGYRVFEAADGAAALRLLEERAHEVALVFSDVVMPGFPNGHELADLVEARYPHLRVLLTSGFPGDAWGEGRARRQLLNKPFRKAALATAIRWALDGDVETELGPA